VQRALESLLSELVLGAEIDLADRAAIGGWLSRHGVGEEDARAIESSDLSRLWVYRRLARGTLREAVELAVPRSIARLGPLFEEYFARFLAELGPRSHYLRDVTVEFLDFAEPLLRADARAPDYICDLARHEALRIEVASERGLTEGQRPAPLELDRGVCFVPASRVVRYAFAVHRLSEDEADRSAPERQATALFVYRSPEHDVRYLELSPLAAGILERLLNERRTLREAVTFACAGENARLDQSVLSGAARLLADLAERGALLGPAVPLATP
jgi:hypothetical protein